MTDPDIVRVTSIDGRMDMEIGVPAMTDRKPFPCIDCGRVELPGNYPFTVCDDCWDKKHPPDPEVRIAISLRRRVYEYWAETYAGDATEEIRGMAISVFDDACKQEASERRSTR